MVSMHTPSTPVRTNPLERVLRKEEHVWETTDEGEREAENLHYQLDRDQRHNFRDHCMSHLNPNDNLPFEEAADYRSQLTQLIHEYAGFDYPAARIIFRALICERYHEAVQRLGLLHERRIKHIPYGVRNPGIKLYEDGLVLVYDLAKDFRLESKDFKVVSLEFLRE